MTKIEQYIILKLNMERWIYMILQAAQFIYSSKYCLYELLIIIGGQGCIICLQLSKYLKEIWYSDASIGNY